MGAKTISDTGITGQLGVNLIERTVLRTGHAWRPIDLHDIGIDGEIELKDPRTGVALHRLVRAQVKTRASFTRETDHSFEFAPSEKDLSYWLRAPVPVILICARANSADAYWVCVTEYFADKERQLARRVIFDKARDRFDETIGPRLVRLAGGPSSAAVPPRAFGTEHLDSTLLPIAHSPSLIWSGPTSCRTSEDAHRRYLEADDGRASDYLLADGRLFAFRDPASCPLRHLLDGPAASFAATEWSMSSQPEDEYRYGRLLQRALLQRFKGELRWDHDDKVFYFRAPREPLGNKFITGATSRGRQVVDVHRFTTDDGEEVVSYVRHHAFAPRFMRLSGRWYLNITPTYHYTLDGERPSRRGDELLTGMKKRERNQAVRDLTQMWRRYLTPAPNLLTANDELITFGPLERVEVDRKLDEKLWKDAEPEKAREIDADQGELEAA